MDKLSEIRELGVMFFEKPEYSQELLVWKDASKETLRSNLSKVVEILESDINGYYAEQIAALAEERGRGEVFWPLRVALSGQKQSPPPLELIQVLGKKEAIERLRGAIELLK